MDTIIYTPFPLAIALFFPFLKYLDMNNPPAGGVVPLCVISNIKIAANGWIFIVLVMLWSFFML